jgi:hypothetical protein
MHLTLPSPRTPHPPLQLPLLPQQVSPKKRKISLHRTKEVLPSPHSCTPPSSHSQWKRERSSRKDAPKENTQKDMKAPPSALHNFETRPRQDEETERIREPETGENKRRIKWKVGI